MPHCIYGLGDTGSRQFVFDEYKKVENDVLGESAWQEREVGDLHTNPDPKFVGRTINNIFFFRNRLGFIAHDTITLSRVGEYGGLYLDTIQVFKEDGPINLFVATTDINILRHAVPTASTLIIFADEAQFVLHSGGQALTPATATLNVLSRYNYSPLVDARAYGNSIIFTSEAGGFAQVLEMSIKEAITSQGLQADSDLLSSHIPSYIPRGIQRMATHNVLGYTFLHTNEESNALTVMTVKTVANKRVQLAFHKWIFDWDIAGVHIVDNILVLVTTNGSLALISLEAPGDIADVTYRDMNNTGDFVPFTSGVWFSNFYFRDRRGLGSNRGRFQIRTILYDAIGEYMTSVSNLQASIYDAMQEMSCFYPLWDDNLTWIDTTLWIDTIPSYTRQYVNDKLVTIMGDNEATKIVFSNNIEHDDKGFELRTVNVEALYYQRSART
jgi:hypothetical protein